MNVLKGMVSIPRTAHKTDCEMIGEIPAACSSNTT